GLMLLMTDPSTSPRTNVGRTIFGAAYGFGYIIAFEVLNRIGAPDLYSKLYPVPVLNLTVKALDAFARTGFVGRLNRRWETALSPRASNAIHMGLWAVVFTALFSNGYFGREHPGRSIEFWKRAVRDRRYSAERGLVKVVGSRAVDPLVPPAERASALNELGVLRMQTGIDASDLTTRINNAAGWFASAAELGSDVAAKNVVQLFLFYRARRSDRDLGRALQRVQQMALTGDAHAAFLTGLAVETGVGVEPDPRGALAMYRRCGKDMLAAQKGIARIGLMRGARFDIEPQASVLRRAALADDGESCYYLAHMARLGRGLPADDRAAQQWLQRAAELGFEPAKAEAKQDGMPPFRPPRRKFLRPPAWATSFPIG
ncbi:MAG TPA: hypothetical protein ENI87_00925, partial [bacterium]|nr:hypothetical protein [bacterium]